MKKLFSYLVLLAFLFKGCTFNTPEITRPEPVYEYPSNPTLEYSIWGDLLLKWDCMNNTKKIILKEFPENSTSLKKEFYPLPTSRCIAVPGLIIGKSYTWQVVVTRPDNSVGVGPLWDFKYLPTTNNSQGFLITKFFAEKELPHLINLIFNVQDFLGNGKQNLTKNEFEFVEDGIIKDFNIKKFNIKNSEQKISILINSREFNGSKIDKNKNLAIDFINKAFAKGLTNLKFAIYSYGDRLKKEVDFTNSKSDLINTINAIQPTIVASDLYASIIDLIEFYNSENNLNNFIDFITIIFTHESDIMGSETVNNLLQKIENKKIISFSVGDKVDTYILNLISNAGLFSDLPTETERLSERVKKLNEKFVSIKESFYNIRYKTFNRGNYNHTITLKLKSNTNTGAVSKLVFDFNTKDFFDIMPGILPNLITAG